MGEQEGAEVFRGPGIHTGIKSMSFGGSTEILVNGLFPRAVGLGLLMLAPSVAAAGLVFVDSISAAGFVGREL